MTPNEIIATILSVLILLKLAVFYLSPNSLKNLQKKMLANVKNTQIVYIVAILIVGYYVLQSLSPVDIGAVFLLSGLLIGLGFVSMPKPFEAMVDSFWRNRKSITKKIWWLWVIWVAIAAYILWTIFG